MKRRRLVSIDDDSSRTTQKSVDAALQDESDVRWADAAGRKSGPWPFLGSPVFCLSRRAVLNAVAVCALIPVVTVARRSSPRMTPNLEGFSEDAVAVTSRPAECVIWMWVGSLNSQRADVGDMSSCMQFNVFHDPVTA